MENPVQKQEASCPVCHVQVRPSDFYCYNCGKELNPKATPVSNMEVAGLLIKSLILPPLGLWWGFKYFSRTTKKAKMAGLAAIVLTFLSLGLATVYMIDLFDEVNRQVTEQVENLQAL